jgi:hypothetical protein
MSNEQQTFPTEQQFDDQELFDDAEAVETPDSPDEPAAESEQPAPEAQAAAPEAPAEKPEVDDNAPLVPSWRLREINEEKRSLADRVKALEAERIQWQTQRPAPKQETQPEKPARPDPLLDPDGYAAAIRAELREEAMAERREESLHNALEAHPEDFKAAYAAAQQANDPALKARMQASRDPGKTLLAWHKEQQTMREVGSDPNAWLEKKLEERLNDPAFLAKAIERARGSAQPQQNGRPRVELPPSLSSASRSTTPQRSTAGDDLSDEGLWEHANG